MSSLVPSLGTLHQPPSVPRSGRTQLAWIPAPRPPVCSPLRGAAKAQQKIKREWTRRVSGIASHHPTPFPPLRPVQDTLIGLGRAQRASICRHTERLPNELGASRHWCASHPPSMDLGRLRVCRLPCLLISSFRPHIPKSLVKTRQRDSYYISRPDGRATCCRAVRLARENLTNYKV